MSLLKNDMYDWGMVPDPSSSPQSWLQCLDNPMSELTDYQDLLGGFKETLKKVENQRDTLIEALDQSIGQTNLLLNRIKRAREIADRGLCHTTVAEMLAALAGEDE